MHSGFLAKKVSGFDTFPPQRRVGLTICCVECPLGFFIFASVAFGSIGRTDALRTPDYELKIRFFKFKSKVISYFVLSR